MIEVRGFFLPDGETHLVPFLRDGPEFAGGPTYQLAKLLAATPYCRGMTHAVDVGAHCGLWTRVLAHMFSRVNAIEPVEAHRACLLKNIRDVESRVRIRPYALGSVDQVDVTLHTGESSSGDTYIQENGSGEHIAKMRTLDGILGVTGAEGSEPAIDFLKIDCEGYEHYIVLGGERRIRQDKPCIVVEQKPGRAQRFGLAQTQACDVLRKWGAEQVWERSGDFCFVWPR